MVYLTGDIHGEVEQVFRLVERYGITSGDIIVLLGDVGVNYFGDRRMDGPDKSFLSGLNIPILCIHGNHEMRPESIRSYKEIRWHSGTVYHEKDYPNLYFAKDGEIYDLEGHTAIAVGGAYSVDKWYRLRRGYAWFSDEQPSDEIKARVEKKLAEADWKVDLVLSHTCPYRFIPQEAFLSGIDQSTVDNSTELWLGALEEKLDYTAWYCGHWHIEKRIEKMHFLFHGVDAL